MSITGDSGESLFLLAGNEMLETEKSNNKQVKYWAPGQQLTEVDLELLKPLICRAEVLGYTPTKAEVRNVNRIKSRFRTWGNAVMAAGLQATNTPEQHHLRAEAKRQRAREKKAQGRESGYPALVRKTTPRAESESKRIEPNDDG
jgi:hypothetical protein